MRKWAWLYAVVLFVVMATPAGARSVANEGDNGFEVAAYVGAGAWAAGRSATDGQGWASAIETQNGWAFNMEYWLYFGCDDVGTGDPAGFLESVSAWGNGSIDEADFTIDPRNGPDKFTDGRAFGLFDDGSLSYVDCAGDGQDMPLVDEEFTIDMKGVGYLYKTSDTESFHIPGVQNDHFRWRGEYRQSYGHVDIGVAGCDEPCTFFVDGGIGKWSYSSHGNSH